jgi:hypothetical protein
MVSRFSFVPRIMGGHDGPNDLRTAPDIDTTSTFHGSLLWVYRAYSIFQSRGMCFLNFLGYHLDYLLT